MARRGVDEPKLCPSCSLRSLLHLVKPVSYTRLPTVQSTLKECAKLRKLTMQNARLPKCPHFPVTERINGWFGARKNRRRKRR